MNLAQNIFLATQNSNFAHNGISEPQTRVSSLKTATPASKSRLRKYSKMMGALNAVALPAGSPERIPPDACGPTIGSARNFPQASQQGRLQRLYANVNLRFWLQTQLSDHNAPDESSDRRGTEVNSGPGRAGVSGSADDVD
jgi:hypothetical protein